MPYQSRGFWCCDFCKLTLDSFEDAKQHETEQCLKNPNKSSSQQQPRRPQQQLPPQPYQQPPFYQQSHPGYYSTGPMAPILSVPVKQERAGYEATSRAAPLMGMNESSNMNTEDAMACQSIEVFEAGSVEASSAELRSQFPSLADGHIGIRCIHCVTASHASPPGENAILFPSSIESMAEDVRKIAAKHLGNCTAVPASMRTMHQQAAEKRRRNDQERGSSWQDDERSLFALKDWCHMFCQRQKIVNKGPSGSGLVFMQHTTVGPSPYSSQDTGMIARVAKRPGTMAADPQAETPSSRRTNDYATARPVGGYDVYGQSSGEAYYPNPEGGHEGLQGQEHAASSPRRGYQQPPMTPVDVHDNFPFFQEANGCWSCKYCCHVPPPYRQPQSMWGAPNHMPPPPQYIDQHLSMCRSYHQSMTSQQMYQGGTSQGQYAYMGQEFPAGSQQGGWEGSVSGSGGQGQAMPYRPQSNLETPPPGTQAHLSTYSAYPPSPNQMVGAASNLSHGMMPQTRPPASSTRVSGTSDAAVQHAIDLLTAAERDTPFTPGVHNTEGPLVIEEDKLLLTDYFFHLMRQLRLCRFSEADRKTRGGKREKILIGFGGLQCIHCSEANNSRKFFWSNVDRLANSFAEIPGHVLKCRHCPQQTKDALYQLKQLHPEQMARLPRGSQKVFFRRMWRRLHDKDPKADSPEQGSPPQVASAGALDEPISIQTKGSGNDSSPGGTTGSDESILLLQRSTIEAAKVLADASAMSYPPSPTSRVLLAIPEDKEWLSDMDVFIRRQIEVFCSTSDDVNVARSDRKFPVNEGQVGIRCIHCALTKQGTGARGSAVAYPFSVSGIYESVREFQRLHLDSCENLPPELKAKLSDMKGSTSLSSVLRKYYVLSAKALGLQDTRDGIRAGAGSIPIGSESTFAFSGSNSAISEEMRRSTMTTFADSSTSQVSRKRKQDTSEDSRANKRSQHEV